MLNHASRLVRAPRRRHAAAAVAAAGVLAGAALVTLPSSTAAVPPTPGRSTTVLANGDFSAGLGGWSGGKGGVALSSSEGRGGTSAASLTAGSSGEAVLRHDTVARPLARLDRYRAVAWVRTTAPRTRVSLSVSGLPPRTGTQQVREKVLKKRGWRRLAFTYVAPRDADGLVVKVGVSGLRSGGRVLVDDVVLAPLSRALLHSSFDRLAPGPISPRSFMKNVGGGNDSSYDYDDTSIAEASGQHGNVIRTRLEAGTIRNSPAGNNGIVVFVPLDQTVTSACISYDIRFQKRFDWSLGGKLPGLLGVAPGVSPSVPTGGTRAGSAGWSSRMMWLTPKSYSWAGPVNMAISYLYHPDQATSYGDNLAWGRGFKAGRWHTVKQCHVMNTVGRYDGRLTAWFDGTKVLDRQNVRYRTRSDVGITHLSWSIFRGGGTMNWAGSRDNHIDIDNLVVY